MELGHQAFGGGQDCTFETILRRHELTDPVLWKLAEAVHEADLEDDRYDAPDAPGLDAILRGLSMTPSTTRRSSPSRAPCSTGSTSTTAVPCCSASLPPDHMTTATLPPEPAVTPPDERSRVSADDISAPDATASPPSDAAPDTRAGADVVPFRSALRAWFLISLQTFGGPAGQIAVMQRALVDEHRWISQGRFLHALSYCMLLPGPEAHQLAIYVGWLLNGRRGGLAAGVLFVLPGVASLLALSALYVALADTTVVAALFTGLAAAVVAIVAQAVVRVAGRALRNRVLVGVAVASFVSLAVFGVPFPIVLAAAALIGWYGKRNPELARPPAHKEATDGPEPLIRDDTLHTARPSTARTIRSLGLGVIVWLAPVAAVAALTGIGSVYTSQGLFFSGTALITFGGAYAVLAFVAQQAVQTFGWVTSADMVRGLALAETTPGPLIIVVQFVAFLGAYANPGTLSPWVAGVLASLLVSWVTFVPSFLFIFLGAPYIERLRHNTGLTAALSGITAAVVGVIANLGLFFAISTLFSRTISLDDGPLALQLPDLSSLRPVPAVLVAIASILLFVLRWPVLRVLGSCAVLGLGAGLLLPGLT
ncbi:chromate efflux transporter [Pseudonocardia halophobica]|uniref:chromate efflux transporter n=1 Tax=Pseudonocardia halophobica TaxID=29401 RepID=UPI003D9441C6